MPYIKVRENKIHYTGGGRFGKSRPSILLIHGAGQSTATWEYQIYPLKTHTEFNLAAPDLPGHGKSGGEGSRTIKEYKEFIKEFADKLGFGELIIVGHSMGGGIAQLFTLEHPERVEACVLAGTGAKLKVAGESLRAAKNDYKTFCEVAPGRAFSENASEELKKKFKNGLLDTSPQVSYHDLVACDEFDMTAQVEEIKAPVLVISGEKDILTPVKYGEFLNEKIEGSKFRVIDDAGHFMMLEKPDEFNRLLLEFLETI